MISKKQIKNVTALHHKKFRREKNQFVAEGEKVVADLLSSGLNVITLFANQKYFQNISSGARISKTTAVVLVSDDELSKLSALTTPHSVLAVAEIPSEKKELNFSSGLKLVLDGISDPGNLGTLLRIADWFGIDAVICSNDSADCYSPKVVQSAMGSLFRKNIQYHELTEIFSKNKSMSKLPVYGTLLEGKNIYDSNLSNDGFIVLGNESNGIRTEVLEFVTDAITIPPFNDGRIDSLNAAVAAGIICSEFKRRRLSDLKNM